MSYDAFLKISKIPGGSTAKGHEQWIEILSFSHGAVQPARGSQSSGGSGGGSRVDLQDFSVVKLMDKTSPLLFLNCCKGEHLEATIELCQAAGTQEKYLEYKLKEVVISSVRPGGSSQGGENFPLEEVSFRYGEIEVIFYPRDAAGKAQGAVPAKWNLKTNSAG